MRIAELTLCSEEKLIPYLHLDTKLDADNPAWQFVKSFLKQAGLMGFCLHANSRWLTGHECLGKGNLDKFVRLSSLS